MNVFIKVNTFIKEIFSQGYSTHLLLLIASFLSVNGSIFYLIHKKIYQLHTKPPLELSKEKDNHKSNSHPQSICQVNLGQFKISVHSEHTSQFGTTNMGSVEIVLICDEPSTREWIEENKTVIQDHISNLLQHIEREDFFDQERKIRLKHTLIKAINSVLPEGIIEEIYFSNLIFT